jgi:Tfp pilus assembly protein PilN
MEAQSPMFSFSTSQEGEPVGGVTNGIGLQIRWQSGSAKKNGAFLEEVVEAAIQRLTYLQGTKYNCRENAEALYHLAKAQEAFQTRQQRLTDNQSSQEYDGPYGDPTPEQ